MAPPRKYRMAGAQIFVTRDVIRNTRSIVDHIRRAGGEDVDFLVFPEMALTGYYGGFLQSERDRALKKIRAEVANAGVVVLLGTGHKQGRDCYNQVRVYAGNGRLIGTHEKTIPTDSDMSYCTRGWGPRIFRHKGLMFGCLVCNDFWVAPTFGTLPDVNLPGWLTFLGAEVIFHSVWSGSSKRGLFFHTGMYERRARENGLFIVTANGAQEKGVNAPSGIMSPDGTWLVKANRKGEQMYVHDIELPAHTQRPWR